MTSLFKIPLFFLLIGSLIGLFFRFHFVFPVPWLNYGNWLHAHSHVMFLGWATNFLSLAFVASFVSEKEHRSFRWVYIAWQIPMIGLLVSFPLQGYGLISVTLLSLHILLGYYFSYLFYKKIRNNVDPAVWLAKASIFFFIFSSIGAFALGPLAASGMKNSEWYYYAILFYLHFQYNGVFVFGVFALFLELLKTRGVPVDNKVAKRMALLLFISCFPAYLLSITWSDAGAFIIWIAMAAAIIQLVSFVSLLRIVFPVRKEIKSKIARPSWILLNVAGLSYMIKLGLQGLSVIPDIARLASQVRYLLVAYLHLVLIGVVSFFLFVWIEERKLVRRLPASLCWLLVVSFVASEAVMVLTPFFGSVYSTWSQLLLLFSSGLFAGFASYFFRVNPEPARAFYDQRD